MRRLRTDSEDEMIALVLGGEFMSNRFGPTIGDLLRSRGIDRRVVASPNLAYARQNAQRREVLAEYVSATAASSTSQVPSSYAGLTSAAACSARRVLPQPPAPSQGEELAGREQRLDFMKLVLSTDEARPL